MPLPINADFKESEPIITDEVNFFTVPPVNISSDKVTWVEQNPTFISTDGKHNVSFKISGSGGSSFIDLSRTELKVRIKIIDSSTKEVFAQTDGHSALPIDCFLHTMWKSIDIKIAGALVSSSGTDYMYKAFFENLLTYSESARRVQMSSVGFTGESGDFAQTNPDQIPYNSGLKRRKDWFKSIKIGQADPKCVEFSGKLCSDICSQERLILNNCRIYVNLFPNSDEFRLITHPEGVIAKVEIDDIKLNVCKVQIDPMVMIGISKGLELSPALYPFRKTEIRTHNITKDSFWASYEDQFQGDVPNRLIIGLVDAKSYAGDFGKNPLMFEDFNLKEIGFFVDNEPIPCKPININMSQDIYMEGLMSLYKVSGKLNENTDIGIGRKTYRQGYTLFGFEVNPNTDDDFLYLGKCRKGTTRIDLSFHKAVPKQATIIIYATFPEIMEIDQTRVARLRNKQNIEG